MPDPTNENAGATPPENPPAGEAPGAPQPAAEAAAAGADAAEAQTQATPAAAATPTPEQVAVAQTEQPTAVMPPAYAATAGTPPAPPRDAWYRRRWAVITGAVAAAVILFLGGIAVGTAIGGDDRDDFRIGGGPGMMRPDGGQGFGHEGWGDGSQNGQGMVPPGMGQGGHGFGQGGQGFGQDGEGWDQDGDGYGQPQAPDATPAPVPSQSTTPQALSL